MARKTTSGTTSNAGVPDVRALLEARLSEVKRAKVEQLAAIQKYHDTHRLLTFQPHTKQQLFFDALRDVSLSTFVLLGGNRSGKTSASVAAALSLAMGRLPWIGVPKGCEFPDPLIIKTNEAGVAVHFASLEGVPEPETYKPGTHTPHNPDPHSRKPMKPIPTFYRLWETPAEFAAYKRGLSAPPDPGALRFQPPLKIRVLAEDMTALEQVTLPKFRHYAAPEWVAAKKKNSFGVDAHWIFANGSVIDFLTYNQDPAMMEGWDGHVVIYDEPPPRPVYIANSRGLIDHNGISIFSMTPLKEPWIADEIVNKPASDIWTLYMDMDDNPHLDAKSKADFISKLTPDEIETRKSGKFLHLQGLVYPQFKPSIHVIDCSEPPLDTTVYVALDTHPRTEQAVLFMFVDKRGNMFVTHEIFQHATPEQVADWVIEYDKTIHKVEQVLIDPSSQGDKNRGDSTFEVIENKLAARQIPLEFGSKDLRSGILLVQDALKSRNGVASLFIDRKCTRTIWEFGRYIWDSWKNQGNQEKGDRNKPRDCEDHQQENLRRLVQYPAVYKSPNTAAEFMRKNTWTPTDPDTGY